MTDKPPIPSPDKLLTVVEVASKLSISKSKVYQLISARAIQVVRIDRAVRIDPADLSYYIENCKSLQIDFPETSPVRNRDV